MSIVFVNFDFFYYFKFNFRFLDTVGIIREKNYSHLKAECLSLPTVPRNSRLGSKSSYHIAVKADICCRKSFKSFFFLTLDFYVL